jgi:hypothetical protein
MKYHVSIARAGWRYTATDKFLVDTSGAWIREKFENSNREAQPLGYGHYGEWVGNINATYSFTPSAPLRGGWSSRRMTTALLCYISTTARASACAISLTAQHCVKAAMWSKHGPRE